jgi:acetylornithine deacetylase/succinyl-diaminopimelate desuccinylase family protein
MDVVQLLSDLIAIPSVNPMGRDLSGPEFFEYRLTDYLESFFRELGVPYQRQHVEPLRDNLIARLDGDRSPRAGSPVILFEAHQDTVPCDGMTIDPWKPRIEGGRIYGRGACDIKGGMAAMLSAFARAARERPSGLPTVLMACTVNEEHGYTGATALCEQWTKPGDSIFPRRPDVAIVAEPTELDVVVAHKGTVRWRLHTKGRAIHSSKPHLGENAIYHMAPVLDALRRYAQQIGSQVPPHRLCGPATLSVGIIRGGVSVNTVPDDCIIEIDRRLLPGEDGMQAYREVVDYVARSIPGDVRVEHEPPFMCSVGLEDHQNGTWAKRLVEAVRRVRGRCQTIGVPFGTDAAQFAAAGVPSVVFGPGSVEQAHTADEWLPLDQLSLAAEGLYELIKENAA